VERINIVYSLGKFKKMLSIRRMHGMETSKLESNFHDTSVLPIAPKHRKDNYFCTKPCILSYTYRNVLYCGTSLMLSTEFQKNPSFNVRL
jgi:hypothetical protein